MYMHQKSVIDAETRFKELLKLPKRVKELEHEVGRRVGEWIGEW